MFHPNMVGLAFVDADVLPVFSIILVNSRAELFFCKRVIFIWHSDVPKNVMVALFGDKIATRQLRVIIVWPYCDNFKLTCLAVEIHLKVMVIIRSKTCEFTILEGNTLYLIGKLVFIWVEIERVILEVVDDERIAVIIRLSLRAHTANHTQTAWIYVRKGILLIMVIYAVFLSMKFDVFQATRQHQTIMPIFLRVDISCATNREQTCVELGCVAGVSLQFRQSIAIANGKFLTMLTTANVYGLPFNPPFCLSTYLFSDFLQGFIAILAIIVNDNVISAIHLANLPVSSMIQAIIDALHYHLHMVTWWSRESEHWFSIAIGGFKHQETLDDALYAIQFQIIHPFCFVVLLWGILFHQPITFALKVRVIVHVKGNVGIMGE